MPTNVLALISTAALLANLTGCGSAPVPNAETPPTQVTTHIVPAEATPPAASEPPASDTASSTAPSEDPRADGMRKASRPPAELITGPNLVYVFNFKESEVGIAAKERCTAENDQPNAIPACLEKARGKVAVELIRFVKEPNGDHWWVTYNRYKGNLLKWHRVQFQPGEQGDDRITLNLIGKDKGIAPMARVPRQLQIALPNDYSITVNDPEHGAMHYDAKIGMMDID